MGFVVEDGTGQDDATSYVSVEAFIAYWLDRNIDYSDSRTRWRCRWPKQRQGRF